MLFKNRSINLKLVKDDSTETEPKDPIQSVLVAQGYAAVAEQLVKGVSEAVITVIVVKTTCDVVKIGLKALTK
jgi:hypothetical protein